MIRRFGHSLSPVLLALLVAEALTLFVSFSLGPVLWRAWVERSAGPSLDVVLPNALVFTLVKTAILIAMGVYERNFWRGPGDLWLRVGVSFLFGLFALSPRRLAVSPWN